MQYCTLDVISSLVLNDKLGHLKADADKFDYICTMESTVPIMLEDSIIPWVVVILQSPPR